jgi:hypothetical protein
MMAESTGALFPLPKRVLARKVRFAALRRARAGRVAELRRGTMQGRPRRSRQGRRS